MEVGGRLARLSRNGDNSISNTRSPKSQVGTSERHTEFSDSDCGNLKDICDTPCPEHISSKSEFYCENHDASCCGTCVMLLHKTCGKIVHLPKEAGNVNVTRSKSFLGDILKKVGGRSKTLENLSRSVTNKNVEAERNVKDFRQILNRHLDKKTAEQEINIDKQYVINQQNCKTSSKKNTNLRMHIEAELSGIDNFLTKQQIARAYLKIKSNKVDELKAKAVEVDERQTEIKASLLFEFKPEYSVLSAIQETEEFGQICNKGSPQTSSDCSITKANRNYLNFMRKQRNSIAKFIMIFLLVILYQLMMTVPKHEDSFLKPVDMSAEWFFRQASFSCLQWLVSSICFGVVLLVSTVCYGYSKLLSNICTGVFWTMSSIYSGVVWFFSNITSGIVCLVHTMYAGFVWRMYSIYSGVFWFFSIITSGIVCLVHTMHAGFVWRMQSIYSGVVWFFISKMSGVVCLVHNIYSVAVSLVHHICSVLVWLTHKTYSGFAWLFRICGSVWFIHNVTECTFSLCESIFYCVFWLVKNFDYVFYSCFRSYDFALVNATRIKTKRRRGHKYRYR